VTTTPDFFTIKENRDDDHVVELAVRWILIGLLVVIGAVVALTTFS
jgi:hypothetical protein